MLDIDGMFLYLRNRLKRAQDFVEVHKFNSLYNDELISFDGRIEELKEILEYMTSQEKSSAEKRNKLSKENSDYVNHHNLNGRKNKTLPNGKCVSK